jgi:hypothetical protein
MATSLSTVEVVKDSDTTTITRRMSLLVAGVPPMRHYLPAPGGDYPQFLPQRIRVEVVNGEWAKVVIDGPRLRKDGSPSHAQKGEQYWNAYGMKDLPIWLRDAIQRQLDRVPTPMAPGSEAGIAL